VREQLKELTKQYDKSENDLKALQSVGQVSMSKTLFQKQTSRRHFVELSRFLNRLHLYHGYKSVI
jgi:hypothetical protein